MHTAEQGGVLHTDKHGCRVCSVQRDQGDQFVDFCKVYSSCRGAVFRWSASHRREHTLPALSLCPQRKTLPTFELEANGIWNMAVSMAVAHTKDSAHSELPVISTPHNDC